MKGIVLAGGTGSRLFPVTMGVSKQLLPVYDKPMIYYPISVLMLAGIQKILIITTPGDILNFQRLLGNGEQFGVQFSYAEQSKPRGIAEAFIIGEKFIGDDSVCLILGDNIFYGHGLTGILNDARANQCRGATMFCCYVRDAQQFGVVELDAVGNVVSIEEKPANPKSNLAATGLYFFNSKVVETAKKLNPSSRNELEITDLLREYLLVDELQTTVLGRGIAWLDTGTHESLLDAGQFVSAVEKRQGLKIACLEEIGYANGWIDEQELRKRIIMLSKTEYGQYLQRTVEVNANQ
ncbi:glucose-1-phosphate thymidylyltransferase RfbA [Alphaproteobacteria bacterium]|nr:glucose-1-phosphate thymidylyltransferase RfbA [Alphaproteobacteria bacterium]